MPYLVFPGRLFLLDKNGLIKEENSGEWVKAINSGLLPTCLIASSTDIFPLLDAESWITFFIKPINCFSNNCLGSSCCSVVSSSWEVVPVALVTNLVNLLAPGPV